MSAGHEETQQNPAGNLRVLNTGKAETAQSARNQLLELLAQADRGEVLAVFGVVERPNGCYEDFGSSTMSRLQTAGALLESACLRLGFAQK